MGSRDEQGGVLQTLALRGGILAANVAVDPFKVAAYFGVDTIVVELPTALTPAYQAHQEPGAPKEDHHRTPTVTFTGIPIVTKDACTQHVL